MKVHNKLKIHFHQFQSMNENIVELFIAGLYITQRFLYVFYYIHRFIKLKFNLCGKHTNLGENLPKTTQTTLPESNIYVFSSLHAFAYDIIYVLKLYIHISIKRDF